MDDRQPVIILQEDLCILYTEVMWVGGVKGKLAWGSIGKDGANEGFIQGK